MGSGTIRIGGACGVTASLVGIPVHLAGAAESTAGGTLPLLFVLFGVLFLGVLISMLRSAAGPTGAVYTALLGAAMFVTLTAAGQAAGGTGLFDYSHIGAGTLIFAAAYVIWRTRVLPKWSAALAVLGVLPLLHSWVGSAGAYSMIAWIGLTGLLMLAVPPVVRVESLMA